MKKVLIGLTAVALAASAPAQAASSADVIGAIIGGVVVGKILSDNDRQQHVAVQPVIVPQQTVVVTPAQPVQCVTPMVDNYGYVRYVVVPCPYPMR